MDFKYTSIETRKLIEKFLENCLPKDIASELQLKIPTVQRILEAYREAGQISAKKNSGRPPKSRGKSRSTLRRLAVMCPKLISKQLNANWSDGIMYIMLLLKY